MYIFRTALIFVAIAIGSSAAYAADRLPAWLLAVPEAANYVLVADTSTATLHRFKHQDGAWRWFDATYMSVGLNGVRKQRTWDKRTPVGAYFITEELDTQPLHAKYGAAAFPLDYPNTWDRLKQRSGYGIWLHGVDRHNPKRPPLDTDGCLSLPNDAIEAMAGELRIWSTPVLVADAMRWRPAAEVDRLGLALSEAVDAWKDSISAGDFGRYINLYSETFTLDGMGRQDWLEYQAKTFAARDRPAQIEIRDLYLLEEPGEPGLYLSRFRQTSTQGDETVSFVKRLYWREDDDGYLRIVTEGSG